MLMLIVSGGFCNAMQRCLCYFTGFQQAALFLNSENVCIYGNMFSTHVLHVHPQCSVNRKPIYKSRAKTREPDTTGKMFIQIPPPGLFFMSRVESGLCLIRRHGCPRKFESHDAASSPQSTVSTLGEGGGLYSGDPEGNLQTLMPLTIWCDI